MKSATPIRDLTAAARAGLSGNWGKSIGVPVVYVILLTGVSLVPWLGPLLQFLFSAPLVVGMTVYFLATVRKRLNLFSLLFEGFNCFGTALCTCLLVYLLMFAWMIPFLALAIPLFIFLKTIPPLTFAAISAVLCLGAMSFMIVIQMRYGLALYVVADDPSVRAGQAVRRSAGLMKGNYWRLGLLWLRFTGWGFLAALTLGIGFIWLGPYYMAAMAAFYDDLSRQQPSGIS